MKIVVPTDFSENARHALKYADALAGTLQAEIVLLHVYTPAVPRTNPAYPLIQEEITRHINELHKRLSDWCSDIWDPAKTHSKMVVTGDTVQEIVRAAEQLKADLIVMGTKGASGLQKILFGSNTASVIGKAPCPVLAVPEKAAIAPFKRIVFATDYHEEDMTILKSLARLIEVLQAELMIVHVSKTKRKSERDLIKQFSKAVAQETGMKQPFYYVMPHTDVKKGLNQFLDSSGADLLVMSTRDRGIIEQLLSRSLTKQMAYHLRLPLLAYPQPV
jgi:nucleotide-binding universal stress UspA family protein